MLPVKESIKDEFLCSAAAQDAGVEYGVNFDLLQAISATESGRWNNLQNRYVAWPWTVNVGGKGYYFASKAEAVNAVKKYQKQGISSIDVGCMQINLKYHGEEFASLDDAFDPLKNVQYGAKFLRKLYKRHGYNWKKAVKRYHSSNPQRGEAYTQRLEKRFEKFKVAGYTQTATLF